LSLKQQGITKINLKFYEIDFDYHRDERNKMENGTEDIRVLSLGDFNDQEVRKLLAPIIYLAVLMTIGIPGNLIVMINVVKCESNFIML
jgi:hypothetical protein